MGRIDENQFAHKEGDMGKSGQQAFLTGVTQEDLHIRMIGVAIELHATHGRYFAVAFLEENNFGMGEGYWDLVIEPDGSSISSGYAAPIVGCSQGSNSAMSTSRLCTV